MKYGIAHRVETICTSQTNVMLLFFIMVKCGPSLLKFRDVAFVEPETIVLSPACMGCGKTKHRKATRTIARITMHHKRRPIAPILGVWSNSSASLPDGSNDWRARLKFVS